MASNRAPQVVAQPYNWPHDGDLRAENTVLLVIDMQRDFLEPGGYMTLQSLNPLPLRRTISPVSRLCALFSNLDLPIIFTREGHRPDLSTLSSRELFRSRNNTNCLGIGDSCPVQLLPQGVEALGRALVRGQSGHAIIPELLQFCKDECNVIDKPGRSAFAHTELELMLRIKGVRNIVLCGVTTDVCVHGTMREANDRGFDVCLVQDACAAGDVTMDGPAELDHWAVESVLGEGGIFGTVSRMEDVVSGLSRALEVSTS